MEESLEEIKNIAYENNLMLNQIIKFINLWAQNSDRENMNDFNMNILANLIGNMFERR